MVEAVGTRGAPGGGEPPGVAQQRELYGEPVRDLVRRAAAALGLTQGGVARVVGLSPAMLSQLVGGQRVKIGNPRAVSRLQALLRLAEEAPGLPREEVERRLALVRDDTAPVLTSGAATAVLPRTGAPAPAPDVVDAVRGVLRAVCSGRELARAAEVLDDVAPGLAEVVRAYGTGDRADAEEHLAAIAHLLRG